MLSISSTFTSITFDEDVVDMLLADMTKFKHSVLFSPLNVFSSYKVVQGPEGTHEEEKQLHLFFLCFCTKVISFLGSVMRFTSTTFYPILSPHL